MNSILGPGVMINLSSLTGTITPDSAQTTLAPITLSITGVSGSVTYLWSVTCVEPPNSTYTSAAAPASPTSASTTLTPDGPGDYVITCTLTSGTNTLILRRLVTVTRPQPVPSSTLGLVIYMAAGTYSPTLSETAGADTVTWVTSCTKATDGSSVSVTNPTTTTPSFSVASITAYRVRHRCTDAYGRVTDYVVTVTESSAYTPDLTVSLSTGATVAQGAPGAQVITATATGGTGSKTYAWTAKYQDGSSANSLLSNAAIANPTLTTTAYAQRVIATCTATDSGSPAQVAPASVMVTVALTPIVFSNPSAQATLVAGAASITFSTATGGVGTITPGTATLAKPAGSSATLSGTGYGAYTFTTDLPGTYAVTQSVTDSLGQSAQATGTVALSLAGPTWETLGDYNLVTCDTASISAAGAFNITRSGAAVVTATAYTSGAVTTPAWGITNGTGAYLSQASGGGETFLAFTTPTFSATKRVAFQFLSALQVYSGSNDSKVIARISNANDFNTGATKSIVIFQYKSGGVYYLVHDYHTGGTPSQAALRTNAADMTGLVCITLIIDGMQVYCYVHTGLSDYQPMDSLEDSSPIVKTWSLAQNPAGNFVRAFEPSYFSFGNLDNTGACTMKKVRAMQAARN